MVCHLSKGAGYDCQRHYEILGNSVLCVFLDANAPALAGEYFVDGQNCLTFSSPEELLAKIENMTEPTATHRRSREDLVGRHLASKRAEQFLLTTMRHGVTRQKAGLRSGLEWHCGYGGTCPGRQCCRSCSRVTRSPLSAFPPTTGRANLAPCLESALAQTYEKFEVLVVDDASTDETVTVPSASRRATLGFGCPGMLTTWDSWGTGPLCRARRVEPGSSFSSRTTISLPRAWPPCSTTRGPTPRSW